MTLQQSDWRTYNRKVNRSVIRQLKNLQPKRQGHWNKAIEALTTQMSRILYQWAEELTTQRSMTLSQCDWRTCNPKVKDTVTRQLKNVHPVGEEICNKESEELTIQRSRKLQQCNWRTYKTKVNELCVKAIEVLTTQRSRKNVTWQTNYLQPQSQGQCNKATQENPTKRAMNM